MRHAGKAAIDTKQRRPTVTVVRGRLEKPQHREGAAEGLGEVIAIS